MKWRLCLIVLFLILPIKALHAEKGEITSVDIVQRTAGAVANNPFGNCLNYKVIGTCFFLVCDWGCRINKTLKLRHNLPDVVIATFPLREQNPWKEMRIVDKVIFSGGDVLVKNSFKLMGLPSNVEVESFNVESSDRNISPDTKFMEASVIGNPALTLGNLQGTLFLRSQAVPLRPYHHSGMDGIAWRSSEIEVLHPSILSHEYDIRNDNSYTWGATYPRTGFVYNPNMAKSAAVIASRAASIATSSANFHVSTNLNAQPCPNSRCQTAGEALVTNEKVRWQRILPMGENICTAKISTASEPTWVNEAYKGQEKTDGYVWILWREYKGCQKSRGSFLFDIEWG